MIQLYCGDGKGKTTAAVGGAIRAAGRERRVLFAQFMKGGESGELAVLKSLPQVRLLRSERAFPFYSQMDGRQKAELAAIHDRILEAILAALQQGEADFIVLDEITYPVNFRLLSTEKLNCILTFGKSEENKEVELILTGRDPSRELLEISDYISEIRCVRHPFEKGRKARLGVEL